MTSQVTSLRRGVIGSAAIKVPCKTATTANITLSGEQTIDGVAVVDGDRVLVKSQTDGTENGVYTVDTSSWDRAPDWDGEFDVKEGTSVYVTDGLTTQGHWRVTTSDPITVGTTSVSLVASDIDSTLREDLASTDTDDGTKGFHLVSYPPLSGETGVVNYEYEYGSAKRTGVVLDNSTDDTTAVINAIANLRDGEVLEIPPSSTAMRINVGEIALPTDRQIRIVGNGVDLVHSGSGNVFTIETGTSPSAPQHIIEGINASKSSGTEGTGTFLEITDSQHQTLRDCTITDFEQGVELAISAFWCEANTISNTVFYDNDYAIRFTRSGGNFSFASTKFSHVAITTANAQAATAYGVHIGTDLDIYRSEFDQLVIFPAKSSSVAFYCDGKMRNVHGTLHIEGNNGSATGNTGIQFGSNASLLFFDLMGDIRGTIANKITLDSATTDFTGLRTNSLSDTNAQIVRSGRASDVRSVVDEDLSTVRLVEKVTSAGVYQYHVDSSLPSEFVDYTTGNLSPIRMLDVGNAEATATDADTTPTVADITRLALNNTGATTVTDFDDGVDGQEIIVRHVNTNTTINHGVNIVLSGSANFTPTSNHTIQVFRNYGGTVWREVSRIEP